MGSPYRELPKYLLCPRCGEMLSRELDGVSTCLRCEGLWIALDALDAAFGDPQWPPGNTQWWRNSLDCPTCGFEGKPSQMTARMADTVLVDRCAEHGLWLDRGELGRLMGGTLGAAGDELAALRDRLHVAEPELERLGIRRSQWRADLEARRRIAAEYHQAQDVENRRRAAIATAERNRREEASAEAEAARREREPRRPHATEPPPPVYNDEAARRATRMQEVGSQRAQTAAEIGRLESQLGVMREHVQRLDAELTRTRYRASSIEHELEAARARLHQLGDE